MIKINIKLFYCVLVAIFSWIIGSALIRFKNRNFKTRFNRKFKIEIDDIQIHKYPRHIMSIVSLLLTFVFIIILLRSVDTSGDITDILRNIYEQKATSSSGHFLLHQIEKALIAIAYISIFQIFREYFIQKKAFKNYLILIIPVFCSIICMLVSTDRNVFIRFGIYCLCLWILFFKNKSKYSRKKTNFKILKYTIVVAILMLFLFYGMGKMKQYTSNLERMLGIYGGSGLYNFNLYLDSFNGNYTFGKSTFNEIFKVLAQFGLANKENLVDPEGFIIFRSDNGYVYSSNIYSSLQPFYADFGIFGISIFCFIIGMAFEYIYQRTEKKRFGYSWVFYASFIYPTIYMALVEQFFARMHLGIIYELFWLWFIYTIIYKREKIMKTKICLYNHQTRIS
ncbi:MAG: oligosaccharide repeat unit polymerase, partial [Anaeroplasmataceae bacterium]|nr:oligosaccharide repeat unit polymerase [Anaeroplasmataceae bacterium]